MSGMYFRFACSQEQVEQGSYGRFLFAGTGQLFLTIRGNKSIYGLNPIVSTVFPALL